ncbi:MAG: signal peptidase I [Phycisphaerales bacterium JB052]
MTDQQHASKKNNGAVGIKETLTSLLIAFMLAFLFRGFVIEGFLIPTGSMAPTLLGKHIRMQGEESGYNWAVGPWTYPRGSSEPVRTQMGVAVQDPMSGLRLTEQNDRRLAAGDRVFVLKYLPWLHHPERWDVVVFKNPGTHENYIKRLVGLPGEQVAFVDGDVFTRQYVEGQTETTGWDAWAAGDWQVQRKPERVQREMLQDVFDSAYAPSDPTVIEYHAPLSGATPGWSGVEYGGEYSYEGSGRTALVWNDLRPLTDRNAYNQTRKGFDLFDRSDTPSSIRAFWPFPDADLALSMNVESSASELVVHPTVEARGMIFRASVDLSAGTASVELRDSESPDMPWTVLDEGGFDAVAPGDWARVEFWHIDQALWLFIDDKLVVGGSEAGAYEMTPAQRASAATGMSWGELEDYPDAGDGYETLGVFADSRVYRTPSLRWDFEGDAFRVTNVRVRRDIAYQVSPRQPTRGGHPNYFPTLSGEQFFMCGDNSANSQDSRLWRDNEIYPWVREEVDSTPGTVNRDLIVGKAFVVYFPAPLDDGPLLTPDFGRLRWIW